MDFKPVYIYALVDPRNKEVRYVGQTTSPDVRFHAHVRDAGKCDTAKGAWIRELLEIDLRPLFRVLEKSSPMDADEAEKRQIALWREQGHRLTNRRAARQHERFVLSDDDWISIHGEVAPESLTPLQRKARTMFGSPEFRRRKKEIGRRIAARYQGEYNNKLSAEQVSEIRARYAAGGITQYELALEFGVAQSTVNRAIRRESWVNV